MSTTNSKHETAGRMSQPRTTLFLCGDVMTGRGIDQILPHPSDPMLYERGGAASATNYIALAEHANGPIPRRAPFAYVWGDALAVLNEINPDLRVINLETAVTTSDDYWKAKGIHYRMHPRNAACLTAAAIDCCILANNHVLDWGYRGLEETFQTLEAANIRTVGAGDHLERAEQPAIFDVPQSGRVLVFAGGSPSSGIPYSWGARDDRAGVNLIDETSAESILRIQTLIKRFKQLGDLVVYSIHWGPNWGYEIEPERQRFAHDLIEHGVDVVHGHSSHHFQGIEVYRDRLIIYGCGDFLTDYEGIRGYERYRGELGLMYFVTLDSDCGSLSQLKMRPTRMCRFQVKRASSADAAWIAGILNREGRTLGTRVEKDETEMLTLHWG
jgi:poly-gamma-glutamate synthesis protein (capsule biosynthesis protein)